MYYDTHAHFEGTPAETAAAVLERAFAAGVARLVAVGGSAALNAGALAASQAYPDRVRLALAFDRDQAGTAAPEVFVETLRRIASEHPFAAVGRPVSTSITTPRRPRLRPRSSRPICGWRTRGGCP
jgi:Tat protein secretion system quality control protein TatD with DNase activity